MIRVARVVLAPEVRTVRVGGVEVTGAVLVTPTGGGGGETHGYTHTQTVAQSVWTVTHNLGRYPVAWSLFDDAGRECSQYVVQHLDLDTSRASMDLPTAGLIRLI